MAYEKISDKAFKANNGELVFFDSNRSIEMDEIREFCECNDSEVPEEGSQAYWDIVNDTHEMEAEDFEGNCPEIGWCIMQGTCGLWDGPSDCGTVAEIGNGKELLRFAYTGRGIEDVRISVSKKDGLEISAYHHDGTNHYVLRQLTKAGKSFYDRWQSGDIALSSRECHRKLFQTPRYSKKINFYL